MTAPEAAELLDLIIAKAPALAAAGVRGRVELGGLAFTVAGPEPEAPVVSPGPDEPAPDAMHDMETFGVHASGQRVPRRTRTPLVGPELAR